MVHCGTVDPPRRPLTLIDITMGHCLPLARHLLDRTLADGSRQRHERRVREALKEHLKDALKLERFMRAKEAAAYVRLSYHFPAFPRTGTQPAVISWYLFTIGELLRRRMDYHYSMLSSVDRDFVSASLPTFSMESTTIEAPSPSSGAGFLLPLDFISAAKADACRSADSPPRPRSTTDRTGPDLASTLAGILVKKTCWIPTRRWSSVESVSGAGASSPD